MALTNPKDIPVRISSGYGAFDNILHDAWQAGRTLLMTPASSFPSVAIPRYIDLPKTPSVLPSGVTAFIPAELSIQTSALFNTGAQVLIAEMIELGSLNIATNVFTDGSAMPTRTVFGTSTQLISPVYVEWDSSAPTGTGRSITITYVDQDGNAAETTSNFVINNGSAQWAGGTFPLNLGDWGAKDLTGASLVAGSGTGTLKFYGLVPVVMFTSGVSGGLTTIVDLINMGIVRRLGANAKLGLFGATLAASASSFVGYIRWVGDN